MKIPESFNVSYNYLDSNMVDLINTGCWRANMGLWRDGGLACIDEVTIYNEIIL